MSEKMYVTKFLRDEEQLKQDWLCLLMKDENAPLDVTYKANLIKIQREYYPYAIFDITCEAEWQATSFWEHKEEYQIAREETVYIDYKGKEHKEPGNDFEVSTRGKSHTIDHYRQPMSRTVYDTKTRIVTDNVETTSGYVEPTMFSQKIWTGEGQSLLNWANQFNESQMIDVNKDYFKDYVLIPEGVTRGEAQTRAEEMTRNDVGNVASRDVPGDRYENMSVTSTILEVQRTSLFLGVYHIFYEYEGKNYECLMTGGTQVEDNILGDHPIDNSIKERTDALKDEISRNGFFSKKTLFLIGAIILTPISLFLVLGALILFNIGYLIEAIPLVAVDVYLIKNFAQMQKKKQEVEMERNYLNSNNALLKKQIYDLVQDDSVPEWEKKETIEGWLKSAEGNI